MNSKIIFFIFLVLFSLEPLSASAANATYTYDALGRVTTVLLDNGTKIVYTYDAAGNRTAQTVTCPAAGC